jgi:serine/threonine protein kinase
VYAIATQILEGVRHSHNSKVIHRDLKLENILFADTSKIRIKIVDFGISGIFARTTDSGQSNFGSLRYIAPEVLSGVDNSAKPTLDVWSIGVIIYALLTGKMPFDAEDKPKTIAAITSIKYRSLDNFPQISRPWKKLISGIFRLEPSARWSVMRILDHLRKYRFATDFSDSEEDEPEETKSSTSDTAPQVKPPERNSRKLHTVAGIPSYMKPTRQVRRKSERSKNH